VTFAGNISGSGALNQNGSGNLILTGTSSYTGATTVSTGSLQVDGVLGNTAVTVQNGATLAGQGTIGGSVAILNGGILAPGPGAQTLTVGSLSLTSGSILDYQLSTPGVIGSGVNSLVDVMGNLTLAGVLNVTNGANFASGAYRLINYTGGLTDLTLALGTLPTGFSAANVTVSTAVSGQVNLVVNGTGAPTQFWDGPNTVNDGTVHGGTGTWDNFTTNFTNAAGKINQSWQNGVAIFAANPGTVTLGDDILFQGMQFTSDGYTVAGAGAFALQPTVTAMISTDPGVTATISAPIVGPGGLNKAGLGLLNLTGDNTYSGGTTVSAGVLSVVSDSNLGASGVGLTLDNGELETSANFTTARTIALVPNLNGANILGATTGTTAIYSGVISGAGGLSVGDGVDPGTVVLRNVNNSYTGGTTVSDATLSVANDANLGDTSGGLVLDGGELVATGSGFITSRPVTLTANGGTLAAGAGGLAEFQGNITGSGALTIGDVVNTGTVNLGGTNSYSGSTTIVSGATLQALSTGALSSASAFTVTGTLDLNGFSNQIGSLTGAGRVTNEGTVGAALTTGDENPSITFSGVLQDGTASLGLIKVGTGTLTLTGANTYSGTTTISVGTLQAGAATAFSPTSAFTVNGELDLHGFSNTVGSLAGNGTVTNSGETPATLSEGSDGTNTVFSGTLTDGVAALGLTKTGVGTITLTGDNTYTGGTNFTGGVLAVNSGNNLGTGPLSFNAGTLEALVGGSGITSSQAITLNVGGGTLLADPGTASTFNGAISGAGSFTKTGTGTLTLNSINNNYSGGTNLNGGVLAVNSDSNLGTGPLSFDGGTLEALAAGSGITSSETIALNPGGGTFSADLGTTSILSGAIGGAGAFTKLGAGTLTLSSTNNDYTGGTNFNGGILAVNNDSNLGTGPFSFAGGTLEALAGGSGITSSKTVTLNPGGGTFLADIGTTSILSGAISGAGALTKLGVGTLILTATNSYAGGTTIGAGTLQIGNGGTSGSIVGDVIDNGGLAFNRAGSVTVSGAISGSGALTQNGPGNLTLTGTSTYTGATAVSAGTLQVDGVLGNTAVTVQSGATLTGQGTIGGNVTILGNGILAPGPGAQTLGVGTLLLNSGSILDYQLSTPGVIGSGVNSLLNVTGNLTLAGVLNVTNGGNFASGAYRLINYTGALTDLTLDLGTLPTGFSAANVTVSTGVNGQVNLVVSAGGAPTQFWDGPNTVNDGTVHGGTGTWDNFTTNFTNAAGTINQSWQNGVAIFAANPGTVTLGDDILFQGMQFTSDGYTVVGARAFALHPTGTAMISTDPGVTATISAPIVGPGGLDKTDSGQLNLTGPNTYSGGTRVSGGVLSVVTDSNLGDVSIGLTLDGGELLAANGFSSARPVTITANGGTLAATAGGSASFSGNLTGTGSLIIGDPVNTGMISLGGNNTYTGSTTIVTGATLQALSTGALSATSAFLVTGSLDLNGFSNQIGSLAGTGNVTNNGLVPAVLTAGGDNTNTSFSGVLQNGSGILGLAKTGTGTLILTGNNSYSGGTTITGGTLQIGNGILNGSLAGNVTDNGVLAFDSAGSVAFVGAVSGTGALRQLGPASTLILTGANTYSGGTTISAGTLQIGDGGIAGSIAGDVTDNGNLTFNRSDAVIFSGIVSGAGSLTQEGPGTLTLAGTNTYSGGTIILGGTLSVDSDAELGATGVGVGGIAPKGGELLTTVDGFITARAIDVSPTAGSDTLAAATGTTATYAGILSDTGGLVVGDGTHAGTVVLTGANAYSGGTTISGAILQIGNGGSSGSIVGDVTDNGRLAFDRSDAVTFAGNVSGTGSLSQIGAGTVALNGTDTYSGVTTVSAGMLGAGSTTALSPNSAFTVNAILDLNGFSNAVGSLAGTGTVTNSGGTPATLTAGDGTSTTFSGTLMDGGTSSLGFIKTGAGVMILTGANSSTGGTIISAGTLQLGDGLTSGSITGNVTDDGMLTFDRSDTLTYGGVISGAGNLAQIGTGTVILTGTSTYSGGTTISAGTLQLGDGATDGSVSGEIADNGTLAFDPVDSVTMGGVISGAGNLVKIGAGTVILTAINIYSGRTTISAGTLQLGDGIADGSVSGAITDNGTLAFDPVDSVTIGGVISGAGNLVKMGAGSAILTGTNTYSGGTTISAGTLQIGNGGASGGVDGNVADNGSLVFNRSDAVTFAGNVSGFGSLTQNGAGNLTLTGTSTYIGATAVLAGTLQVDGVLGNTAVTVQSGATLTGRGTIGGSVTILDGGILAPGPGAQTLSVGSLLLNSGSILDYQLSTPGVIGSGVNSLVNVAGNLTLAGVLNVTNGGNFASGAYRLINYTGALTDLTLDLGTLPTGFSAANVAVSTGVAGQVNLVVNAAGAPTQFWDGSTTANDGTVHGGTGTWDNFTTNFTNAGVSVNQSWQNGVAIFAATPGTVTLGADILFQGMQFTSDDYTVAGAGSFALHPTGMAIIAVDPGVTAIIAAPIVGTGGLNKTGQGLLTLTGDNSYSGGTTISGGTLRVASDTNLGAAGGGLTLEGGELETIADLTTGRSVALILSVNGANTLGAAANTTAIYTGVISGAGGLSVGDGDDPGTVVLSDLNNSYTGGTTVSDATLRVANDANLGDPSGGLTLNGGELVGSGSGLITSRPIALTANGGTLAAGAGGTADFQGNVTGSGALTIGDPVNNGTVELGGTNAYLGATTIVGGATLRALSTGALSPMSAFLVTGTVDLNGFSNRIGSLAGTGAVTNDGSVGAVLTAGDGSPSIIFSGVLEDGTHSLGLTKVGTGTLVLSGANTYSGGTTVSVGTLQAGSMTGFSPISSFTVNSTLDLNGFSNQVGSLAGSGTVTNSSATPATLTAGGNGTNTVFGGTLADGARSLGLTKTGTGTLTLAGSDTYTGSTTISAGTLQAGSTTGLSQGSAFTVNSILDLDGFSSGIGSLAGNGTVTNSSGTLATLTAGGSNTDTVFSGTLTDGNSSVGLIKTGVGTLILSGANIYSGVTAISAGILQAGSATALSTNSAFTVNSVLDLNGFSNSVGSLAGDGSVTNNGGTPATLTTGGNGTSTVFSGILTDGTGGLGLAKTGIGTLTFSGASTYTGATSVSGGTLEVDGVLGNTSMTVQSGATLSGQGSIAGGVTILDGGHLAPGPGPQTLSVGNLLLNAGSILDYQLSTSGVLGSGVNSLVNVAGNLTLAGVLNVTNGGSFGSGAYRILNYAGALNDLTLELGTLPTGFSTANVIVNTAVAGQVNLVVSVSGMPTQYWDGPNTVNDGKVQGGTGAWNNFTTNFTDAAGTLNQAWQNAFAIFTAAPGTVTLAADIFFQGMQFSSDGYTVAGAETFALHPTGTAIIITDTAMTATIAAPIVGPGGLNKAGAGLLTLTGNNTYSGGTTISGGALSVANDMNLGDPGGGLTLIGGELETSADFATARTIALLATVNGADTLAAAANTTATYTGVISGPGGLSVGDGVHTGTVVLTNPNNSYSGGTNILPGTLVAAGSGALGTDPVQLFDGTLMILAGVTLQNPVTFVEGGVVNNAGTLNNSITDSSSGTETVVNSGIISGNVTLTGATVNVQLFTGSKIGGSLVLNGSSSSTLILDGAGQQLLSLAVIGTVTNNGALIKQGSSTWTIDRALAAPLGTDILAGTLVVDAVLTTPQVNINPGAILELGAGGSVGSLVDNGSLVFASSGTTTFATAIGGPGSVIQNGPGTTILSGRNTYTGGTVVEQGTLLVDNAQALGIGNVTVNGGVLGADPQPINVLGNYTQNAGGTLQLSLAGRAAGQFDVLNVSGNAALNGTLRLLNLGYQPQNGDALRVINAGGVVTGRFSQLLNPFSFTGAFNTVDLVYARNSVTLEFLTLNTPTAPVIMTTDFSSFAFTPNQLAVASLLDAVQLDPRAANLISFLEKQPFDHLPGDFNKISPDGLTAFYEISFSNANIQRLNLEGRLDDIHHGSSGFSSNMKVNGAAVNLEDRADADGKSISDVVEPILQPGPENRWGVWVTGSGDFVSVDADGNAKGYNFTTGGVSLGLDCRITDELAIGVMGEYSHSWTHLNPSGHNDVDSGRGGVYATWYHHGLYLNGAVDGGHNNYDSGRAGLAGLANGSTEGAEWSAFLSGGYDFHFGQLTVGPIASLQYTDVQIDGFSEKGSLAPMQVHSGSVDSLRSDLGLRAFYQWQIGKILIEPSLKVTWEHEYKYSALPITAGFAGIPGPSATFSGPAEGHDSAVLSAGFSIQWTPTITTYLNYDGQLGRENYDSNGVTGGVRISF
jgi:fibronectin-binding autotransporter adhesin